jgi:hypothetical protein
VASEKLKMGCDWQRALQLVFIWSKLEDAQFKND